MIPKRRISIITQMRLFQCFLKIFVQLRDKTSLPKRCESTESCLQWLTRHVVIAGLCTGTPAHSRERVGSYESTWSHSTPQGGGDAGHVRWVDIICSFRNVQLKPLYRQLCDRTFCPVLAMPSLWMRGLQWPCCVYSSEWMVSSSHVVISTRFK